MELNLTDRALSLHPITDSDFPFLLELYASTRATELQRVPHWTETMKAEFVKSQFGFQHDHYQRHYPHAAFWVIRHGNAYAGRLYLDEKFDDSSMRIIDITIAPGFRNKGIGAGIFRDLMAEAAERGRSLTIHVESMNPAKRLYERLGFKMISETNGVYHLMEWKK